MLKRSLQVLGWAAAFIAIGVGLVFLLSGRALESLQAKQRRVHEVNAEISLAWIRTELKSYEAEHDHFPERLEQLQTLSSALKIPDVAIPPYHPPAHIITSVQHLESNDAGGFGYVVNKKDKNYGRVFINCTHPDSRGATWMTK